MANKIKIILIKGSVGPTDLRAASSVKIISMEPINTSIAWGLPTLWAKISGGSKGKYKAEDTSNIELNWCNDANIIVAPLKTVRIPRSTCKKIINPKIITGLIILAAIWLNTKYFQRRSKKS